jgi:hypothetical protein
VLGLKPGMEGDLREGGETGCDVLRLLLEQCGDVFGHAPELHLKQSHRNGARPLWTAWCWTSCACWRGSWAIVTSPATAPTSGAVITSIPRCFQRTIVRSCTNMPWKNPSS